MDISLKDLGLSEAQLKSAVIERMVDRIFDNEDICEGNFKADVNIRVKEKLDEAINNIALQNVMPNFDRLIGEFQIQETNQFGDKKGEPITFTEYLTARAIDYMKEPVNYQGKTQKEDSYSWRKHSERMAWMVNKHVDLHIKRALEEAFKHADGILKDGLSKAFDAELKKFAQTFTLQAKHAQKK